jgi:ApbE superfamily uncharacterized protein (UPF0280 family)
MGTGRFRAITVTEGESDLWIGWNQLGEGHSNHAQSEAAILMNRAGEFVALEAELRYQASELLHRLRSNIQDYAAMHPEFLSSLEPLPYDADVSEPVRSMLMAGRIGGVGPMAAVAGAIAESLGRALQDWFHFDELVIENGGDYWLTVQKPLPVLVYGGLSSLSEKISVIVSPEQSPCGLACSSGTVGPSVSFGKADAALVLARSAAAADAWATALGNRLRYQGDLAKEVEALINMNRDADYDEAYRPQGALAIMADKLAACGNIRLG